jgi:hypothetical protein
MKGDFTRSTFKPEKQYSGVRMQQGRVQLDADWNEQNDINSHRINTGSRDSIGPCGAPQDGGGFKIDPTSDAQNLTISHGRIYVDGILCENSKDIGITAQEDLPNDFPNNKLPDGAGVYLAYLDVWQRHMTAIEDTEIREVALGGPDTATRTKTVWQVRLKKLQDSTVVNGTIICKPIVDEWKNITVGSDANLTAFTKKETPSNNPCIVPPGAGYRGLENQLYRVEIHVGGKLGEAKFKWSRDNGSVVFAVEEFIKDASKNPTNKLKVKQLGKDKTLSLQAGDWVEVLDDAKELSDNPVGILALITENPDVAGRIITLRDSDIISGYDMTRHPKVRRWDMGSDAIPVKPATGPDSIELENGIFVQFSGTSFRAGDYWLIPARTATGDIEWPKDETTPTEPKSEPPEGIRHHYCRLAVLQQDSSKNWSSHDCRKLFPAVTELTSFFHVCGDGQEAMPGEELPEPLQVGVSNGKLPVNGALVKFEIIEGGGILSAGSPVSNPPLVVKTGSDGVDGLAKCTWRLGGMDLENTNVPPHQLVKATLLDACGAAINIPICFNANLSVASDVAYKPPGCTNITTSNGIPTVQDLLKEKVSGWPPADAAGNTTVKDVLDTLLCKLEAGEIPYNPVIKGERWKDINETSDLGTPPAPNTVQDALDDLLANLDSSDIPYRPPNCGTTADPKVRSLLNISAISDSKVKDILDALLCTFDATYLPIQKNNALCKRLNDDASVKTVQDALNALCSMRGGCCVVVDDDEHLSKALSELKDGGVICLLAGEFKADITIEGRNNIVIRGCTLASRLISDIKIGKCNNVVIEKLDISGNIMAEGVDGLSLRENIISQTEKQSFKLVGCSNVKVEKNMLHTYNGINFNGNDIEISDNIITLLQSSEASGWGILIESSNELKILRNRLETDISETLITKEHGHIEVLRGQDVYIENNLIQTKVSGTNVGTIVYGIKLSSVTSHISVIRNRVEGVNGEAVFINGSNAARIYGNELSSSNNDVAEKQGSGIVTLSGLYDVDITDNRITILNPDSILKKHILGLGISGVNGMLSVNNNIVSGVNQEAVHISSTEATARLHGNSFDSLWHIEAITGGINISSIFMECKDIIFGGNQCVLKVPATDTKFIKLLAVAAAAGKINVRQVYFTSFTGSVTVTGNRCSENMKNEQIYSILASNKIAILLGNITTNKVSPVPDPQNLNLRG